MATYDAHVIAESCPKCNQPNKNDVQFCVRCHTPLRVVCPACNHVQASGVACDKCGVDFVKYGLMKLAAMQTEMEQERRRASNRAALTKALLLAPVTLGFSLLSYARARRG